MLLSIDIRNTPTTISNYDIIFIQLILKTIANIIMGLNVFSNLYLSGEEIELLNTLKEDILKVKEMYTITKITSILVTKYKIEQTNKSSVALAFEIRHRLSEYIRAIPNLKMSHVVINGGYNKTIKNKKKAKTYRKNKKKAKTYRKNKKQAKTYRKNKNKPI